MLKKVSAHIEKYHMLSAGDTVVAGVSGGADSVCLLLVLSALKEQIPFTLHVVHVNHKIRPEAGKDAEYVRELCKEHHVPFHLVEKDVEAIAKEKGISTEEAGRMVRYEAFEKILQEEAAVTKGLKIAVAHNLNDRAETMLFHLFRGSGLTGLGSIKPIRFGGEKPDIIRPLLCVSRKEIEEFLISKNVDWCIDSTNEEDTYTRNRIRHHILPFAEKEIAGGAVSNMGRAADILAETEDFVKQESEKAYLECVKNEPLKPFILSVDKFLTYHTLLQKQVILLCLEKLTPARKDITSVHVEEILGLFTKSGNREMHLPYKIVVKRVYDQVLFEKKEEKDKKKQESDVVLVELPKPGEEPVCISLSDTETMEFTVFSYEKSVNIPQNQYTKWFDYDKIEQPLAIRKRQIGDYFTFNEANSKKTLQNYMVETKIPSAERDKIYLLAEGAHILWITGYRISSYYKVKENTKYILQVQLRGGQ